MKAACAGIHWGEEPPLTGSGGSGTIFFTGCTVRCFFCQNYQISCKAVGAEITEDQLTSLCIELQRLGAENINIVTGTHFIPGIYHSLTKAKGNGLSIPIVWNSSGYENDIALSLLDGIIDIYLPDLKTTDTESAEKMGIAPDYADTATQAVMTMVERKPLRYGNTALESGVIVRHLVLPNMMENTRRVLEWFSRHCKGEALLSLLTQFAPPRREGNDCRYDKAGIEKRSLNGEEYDLVLGYLDTYGIEEGFFQESDTDNQWSPDFTTEPVFPSDDFTLLWHWRNP
jgi:putative pyruvate formate lyase activating enzyme